MQFTHPRSVSSDSQHSPLFSHLSQALSPNEKREDALASSFNDCVLNREQDAEDQHILQLNNKAYTSLPLAIDSPNHCLVEIHLSFNQLATFPPELAHCQNLQKLFLDQNRIQAVPDHVAQIQSLKYLNLRSNCISAISPFLSSLANLEVLYLCHNQIAHLPNQFFDFANLRILGLRFNHFSELSHLFSKLVDRLDVLELDWFSYATPPRRDKQFLMNNTKVRTHLKQFLEIYTQTQWPFNCLDFIQHFSKLCQQPISKETLFDAVQNKSVGVVKRICLDKPALIAKQNDQGLYPINFQYLKKNSLYPFLDFYDSGEALNILCLQSLMKKDLDVFRKLTQKKIDYHYTLKCSFNSLLGPGSNAFHCLMYVNEKQRNKVKIAKFLKVLLLHRVDARAKNQARWNCLHVAAHSGMEEAFTLALKYRDSFDFTSKGGDSKDTCLHLAGQKGQLKVLRVLLDDLKVNPFHYNKLNLTAKQKSVLILTIIKVLRRAEIIFLQNLIRNQQNTPYKAQTLDQKSKDFPNLQTKSISNLPKPNDYFQMFQVHIVDIIRNTRHPTKMLYKLLTLAQEYQTLSLSLIINLLLAIINRKVQSQNNIHYKSDTLYATIKLLNLLQFQQKVNLTFEVDELGVFLRDFKENASQNKTVILDKSQVVPVQIVKLNLNVEFQYDISATRLPSGMYEKFFDRIMKEVHALQNNMEPPQWDLRSTRLTILEFERFHLREWKERVKTPKESQAYKLQWQSQSQLQQQSESQLRSPYVSKMRENIKKSQRVMLKQPEGERRPRLRYNLSENVSDESV